MSSNITTIILAGGHSTRMGQDKALLEIQGVPLLKRITDLVLPLSHDVLIISAWPDRYQPVVSASCKFLHDCFTDGPLVGFAQALALVQTEWILLLSCDLPNLDQATLASWIQNLEALPATTIAYLPKGKKGWEPLCGFYRSTCHTAIQQFVDQGGRSFQRWLSTQPVTVLPFADQHMLFNCNTPEDWARICDRTKNRRVENCIILAFRQAMANPC